MAMRDRMAIYALCRAKGMRGPEIAAQMGIQVTTLHSLVSKATRLGIIKFEHPADRLEYELTPQIVDNIKEFLGPTADDAHRLKMTVEAAKGTGLFKSHQAVKIESDTPPMVLALKFELGTSPASTQGGTIIGTPRLPLIDIVAEDT